MKLECPRCGSENQFDETEGACASCGVSLPARAPVRRAGAYDGYAVGRRVLKFVPAWLLLCVACFVVVLLLFKWAARPVGKAGAREDEFRNEATNQTPPTPTPLDSHRSANPSDGTREDAGRVAETSAGGAGGQDEDDTQDAGGARVVSEAEEEAAFSVQAGAFDDHSQANELVSRLRAAGFDARVVEAVDSRRFRFQVRSGLFRTREEAAQLAAQLRAKGVGQTVVIEPHRQ